MMNSVHAWLGDTFQYVEYSTCQEWSSIEAHPDAHEFLAKSQDAAGHHDHTDPINFHVFST